MTTAVEIFGARYAAEAAARISVSLPGEGAVVLTGGTTARFVYEQLARASSGWGDLEVFFSDERGVPPDHEESNYGLASRFLLERVDSGRVHRMRGEADLAEAAASYHDEIAPAVEGGLDLVLLGMGSDCHVAALFPGSPALAEGERLCVAVDRPDGMGGLTLTPPALAAARRVLVLVTGEAKSEAVHRAVAGDEEPEACPARLLAGHPDTTFLLDEAAAARL